MQWNNNNLMLLSPRLHALVCPQMVHQPPPPSTTSSSSHAKMSFQLPSEDDPFPKRFYTMMIFFIVFLIEFILPVVAAIFLLGMIVTICGNMLGLIQLDSPSETINQQTRADRADSADDPDPVQAVDEKTLLEIETKILEEMLQTRRTRLNGLAKSE